MDDDVERKLNDLALFHSSPGVSAAVREIEADTAALMRKGARKLARQEVDLIAELASRGVSPEEAARNWRKVVSPYGVEAPDPDFGADVSNRAAYFSRCVKRWQRYLSENYERLREQTKRSN
jgi:hypothetical protein